MVAEVGQYLQNVVPLLKASDGCNGQLSEYDIHLFTLLRGLSIMKGIKYPNTVDDYRQTMAKLSGINLSDQQAI